MDKDILQKLDKCCENENLSRSEVVRKSIVEHYEELEKK